MCVGRSCGDFIEWEVSNRRPILKKAVELLSIFKEKSQINTIRIKLKDVISANIREVLIAYENKGIIKTRKDLVSSAGVILHAYEEELHGIDSRSLTAGSAASLKIYLQNSVFTAVLGFVENRENKFGVFDNPVSFVELINELNPQTLVSSSSEENVTKKSESDSASLNK